MGYLRLITIYEDKPSRLGKTCRCVEHHLARHLRGCKVPGIIRINLRLSSRMPVGSIEQFGSILDYYGEIDVDQFNAQKSDHDKKQFILDALLLNMKRLFSAQSWDVSRIVQAYDKCQEESLENEWMFKHKLFRSPNGKYCFGLLTRFGIERYEIFEMLFDSNETHLARRLAFVDDFNSFRISWASWEGSNSEFYYKFDGPTKVFVCVIQELLDGVERSLPATTSAFFK